MSPWAKLIIAGIAIGVYPLIVRHANTTPLASAFLVSLTTTVVVGLFFFFSKESMLTATGISWNVASGLLGGLGFLLYIALSADKTIPSSTSLVVINGIALATIIIAGVWFFGEALSFIKITAIILMTASLSLLLTL